MQAEGGPSKRKRGFNNLLQLIGAAWTLVYAVMIFRFESAAGEGGSFWFVFLVFIAPNACMLLTFSFLRTGGILAFSILGFATLLGISQATADMRGAPQALSILVMLVGGPIALVRGHYVYKRRHPGPGRNS